MQSLTSCHDNNGILNQNSNPAGKDKVQTASTRKPPDGNKILLSLKERVINLCLIIFTLGYHRFQQNKLFKVALHNGDFKAAEEAVRMGACDYLSAPDIIDLLKQEKITAINFLFTQATFGKSLNSGGNEILKAVQKINLLNYTEPHYQRLLKLFLENRPLVSFASDYWHGYGTYYPDDGYGPKSWLHVPNFSDTSRKIDKETFLKCRLIENIWMRNPLDTQLFFESGLDPKSILTSPKFHPLLFSPWEGKNYDAAINLGLRMGLNPNISKYAETLLGRALFAREEETARKLLVAGADANKVSYTAWEDYYTGHQYVQGTPLELALRECREAETIRQLLAHGAKPTKNALIASFKNVYGRDEKNKTDIIRLLIESPQLAPECFDNEILDLAIYYQQHWCIDLLLKKGLMPSAEMIKQIAQSKYLETAKLLITGLPALADEKFMEIVVKQKNFALVHWLVQQNPGLKNTKTCQKLLAETQNSVAAKEILIATLK